MNTRNLTEANEHDGGEDSMNFRAARRSLLLLAALALALDQPMASGQDKLTKGLVAYWSFDEGAGNFIVDLSGMGNNGTLLRAVPTAVWTQGQIGTALYFDGHSGAYVRAPSRQSLENFTNITFAAWVRCDDTERDAPIIAKERGDARSYWFGCYATKAFGVLLGWTGSRWVIEDRDNGHVIGGVWTHLASVWDGMTVRHYQNGKYVAGGVSCTGPILIDNTFVAIGVNSELDGTQFKGAIDEVRIYNLALSAAEIEALYAYVGPTNAFPVIYSQPVSTNLYVGESAQLAVTVIGTWPLAYQWSKDGAALTCQTNALLTLANLEILDAGNYTVVVTNAFGATTSAVARVTVTPRPWPYFADFQGSIGQEWSKPQTDVTPLGKRRFLGQFGNEVVALNFNRLPPHRAVTLAFDLLAIRSWDGNGGPDLWNLSVDGGPTLLHTTFLNSMGTPPGSQSFPGSYPGANYAAGAWASETNTLGFMWEWWDWWDYYYEEMDAVYNLVFTFPHSAESLKLNFSAQNLEGIWDESWGLDNVMVTLTPAESVPYVDTQLASLSALALTNRGPVERVVVSGTRALVSAGDDMVDLIDLQNPAKPVLLGSFMPLFPPSDIQLVGNTAYIASYESNFLSTVEIVDFTNPAWPVLKGYYDTDGYAQEVAIVGSTLYVADDEAGLVIVDVSDPAWPRRLGSYDTQGHVRHVQVAGRYAYLTDGAWLLVLDVSNPSAPRRVGHYPVAGGIQAIRVAGPCVYVAEQTGQLLVLDASLVGNIQVAGTYRSWGAQRLALGGAYAYLAKGNRGMEMVDVSSPTNLVWVTGRTTTGPAQDVAAMGNYVLIAAAEAGLQVWQIRQAIYPPLATPVLTNGLLRLSWLSMAGVRLQQCTNLALGTWWDVPGTELTNVVVLNPTEPTSFFRLARP